MVALPLTRLETPALRAVETQALNDEQIFSLVYRQMRALVGPHRDLEDLIQTSLEQVHRSRDRFEGRSQFSTFTHAICYRVWLKHIRWSSRFGLRFSLTLRGELPEVEDTTCPQTVLLEQERYRRLYAALERVSPKRRAVVVLHDMQGLDVEEIAHVVDAKVGTVRSRLRDGRKMLARLLENDPYFGDEACGKGAP